MSSQSGGRTATTLETVEGGSVAAPGRRRRNPLLGIVAFVLAVLVFLALPVAMLVVNQPDFLSHASTISARVVAAQLVAMIVSAGLAIVAVISRRGRSWGVAALAVLVTLLMLGLALPLVFSMMSAGAAAPVA